MRAEDILPENQNTFQFPDGTVIRKGTVGAFLANARIWSDPATPAEQRAAVERDMLDALPALRALGLFDVMAIRDEGLQDLVETQPLAIPALGSPL